MKTFKMFLAIAAAAAAFASCVKYESNADFDEFEVNFIAESIDTKTVFGAKENGQYPTLWTANDENVKISLNFAEPKDGAVLKSADSKTAQFTANFTNDGSNAYTFFAASPASQVTGISSTYKDWTIVIPATQTPTANSVDEAAQIIAAKSATFTSWPTTVPFHFSHLTAYGKISLVNFDAGDATINSVVLSAPDYWAGSWNYYLADNSTKHAGDFSPYSANASKDITVNTSSTSGIWFACAPVDLSGKEMEVQVNTSAGPFFKSFTWPAGKPFVSGKVYSFGVDMSACERRFTWNLSVDQTVTATGTEMSWTSPVANMVCNKDKCSIATDNYYPGKSNYSSTRFYSGSKLTITPQPGYRIEKVVFEATTKGYASALKGSGWTNAAASTDTANEQVVTVIPVDGNSAFYASVGATCGFTSVKVVYAESSAPQTCATPEISFSNPTVTISCSTPGAEIHYTLDGSTPSGSSAEYSEPFDINASKTVKAIAVKDGCSDSAVASMACEYHAPAASITVDGALAVQNAGGQGTVQVQYANKASASVAVFSDSGHTASCSWLSASLNSNGNIVWNAGVNSGKQRTAYIVVTALNVESVATSVEIVVTQEAAAGSGPKVYTKVTDRSEITVDSELIIVAATSNYAMGATKSDNRYAVAITKTGDTVVDPDETVQVLKARAGSKENTVAFYDETGRVYICAASSSSNYMKTQATVDANASFTVSISNGTATLVSSGTFTRNTIMYNSGSNLFSCYASGQKGVSLYKLNGSGTSVSVFAESLAKPVIADVVGDDNDKTVIVEWTDVANATSYTVTCGDQHQEVAAGEEIAEFTMADYGTYSVTVTANAAGYISATSVAGSVTLTDPGAPVGPTSGVLIIDGTPLTTTASTAEKDYTYGDFTITMSQGAKYQAANKTNASNRFTSGDSDRAILIGESGKYIYNKTPIPGSITKFEIYSNYGASQKVSVGVCFSSAPISAYVTGSNTYAATLSTNNKVYDCSDKLPAGAKYFWFQVTNSNNAQVQFRITYSTEAGGSGSDGGGSGVGGSTASVTTGSASSITQSGATLSASYANAPSQPYTLWFEYGTSQSNLNRTAYWNDVIPGTSGNFNVNIYSLAANTTYYYRAVAQIGDEDVYGSIRSFTTSGAVAQQEGGWLELPAPTSGSNYLTGRVMYGAQRNYSYLYDTSMYTALWSAYPLYKDVCSGSLRSDNWSYNPQIPQEYQIDVKSKSYSGNYKAEYSRGHQVPSGDRNVWSTMNNQVFYLSNQVPQIQNGFNGSIWNNLEQDIRTVAKSSSKDTVYVVTGAAFRKVGGNESITYIHSTTVTPRDVPVANYFWKVFLKVKRNSGGAITSASAIGVWLEHKAYDKGSDWKDYVVSVNQIETWTGFDFFVNLPDTLENGAESNTSWSTFSSF